MDDNSNFYVVTYKIDPDNGARSIQDMYGLVTSDDVRDFVAQPDFNTEMSTVCRRDDYKVLFKGIGLAKIDKRERLAEIEGLRRNIVRMNEELDSLINSRV